MLFQFAAIENQVLEHILSLSRYQKLIINQDSNTASH